MAIWAYIGLYRPIYRPVQAIYGHMATYGLDRSHRGGNIQSYVPTAVAIEDPMFPTRWEQSSYAVGGPFVVPYAVEGLAE